MKHACVLDASVALSWVLPDEYTTDTLELRKRSEREPYISLIVPPIFWYEIANVLWVAVRRKRLTPDFALSSLKVLEEFKIDSWMVEPERCLRLALENTLAVYDIGYLAIAEDLRIPLWTIDKQLASVARELEILVEPL